MGWEGGLGSGLGRCGDLGCERGAVGVESGFGCCCVAVVSITEEARLGGSKGNGSE